MSLFFDYEALETDTMPAGPAYHAQQAINDAIQEATGDITQQPRRPRTGTGDINMTESQMYSQEARSRAAEELVEAASVAIKEQDEDVEEKVAPALMYRPSVDESDEDDQDMRPLDPKAVKTDPYDATDSARATAVPETTRSSTTGMPGTARSDRWADDEECLGDYAVDSQRDHEGEFDATDFGREVSDTEEADVAAQEEQAPQEEEARGEEQPQTHGDASEVPNEDRELEQTTHYRRRERPRGGQSHQRKKKAMEARQRGQGEHPPPGALEKDDDGHPTAEAQRIFRQWQSNKQRRKNDELRQRLDAAAQSEQLIESLRSQLRAEQVARESAERTRDVQEALRETVELVLNEREARMQGSGASSSSRAPPRQEGRSYRPSQFEHLNFQDKYRGGDDSGEESEYCYHEDEARQMEVERHWQKIAERDEEVEIARRYEESQRLDRTRSPRHLSQMPRRAPRETSRTNRWNKRRTNTPFDTMPPHPPPPPPGRAASSSSGVRPSQAPHLGLDDEDYDPPAPEQLPQPQRISLQPKAKNFPVPPTGPPTTQRVSSPSNPKRQLPRSPRSESPRVVYDNSGDGPEPSSESDNPWKTVRPRRSRKPTPETKWPDRPMTLAGERATEVKALALPRRYLDVAIEGGVVPVPTGPRVPNSNTNQSYRTVAECTEKDKSDFWRPQCYFNKVLNVVSQDDPRWKHVHDEVTALRMRPEVLSFVGISRLPVVERDIKAWVKKPQRKMGKHFLWRPYDHGKAGLQVCLLHEHVGARQDCMVRARGQQPHGTYRR